MKKLVRRLSVVVGVLFLVAAHAGAQDSPPDDDDKPNVTAKSVQAGPIEFHVVPELGIGIVLEDSQVIAFGGTNAFFLVRIPGLQFPQMNKTSTGVQVEFSNVPGGVRYDILSYTRTRVAGPVYTGFNARIAKGASGLGAALSGQLTPVVGFHLLTISNHVPFFFEVEFAAENRPVKAEMIITWE